MLNTALLLTTLLSVQAVPAESESEPGIKHPADLVVQRKVSQADGKKVHAWKVKAAVGGDRVLTIVCINRLNGDNDELIVMASVNYEWKPTELEKEIVITETRQGAKEGRRFQVKRAGVTNLYNVSDGESARVLTDEVKFGSPRDDIQHIGTLVIVDDEGNTLQWMYFACLGQLSDYPKVEKFIDEGRDLPIRKAGYGLVFGTLPAALGPITKYLKATP